MTERSERRAAGDAASIDAAVDAATEAFVAHRNLLFTVAYEMLGSAADAEDVLQETWLRWVDVDLGTVREERAYLGRIITRQALDRLRVLGRRKESYVGPWLPEPLLTAQRALETGELQSLLDVLAPDVVALSDGGGVRHALLQPVVGIDNVARLLATGWWRREAERSVELVQINGGPGLLVRVDGQVDGVVAVRVENGRITGAYHVRNPEKLSRVERETAVTR